MDYIVLKYIITLNLFRHNAYEFIIRSLIQEMGGRVITKIQSYIS
nr:MAG TPA: hypothetical protein [Caudoviricetes sp.]DAS84376.1 MAG TPA: hypothetical protein [Caudoviricetes sp.]